MNYPPNVEISRVLKVLEILKQASEELQRHNSAESDSSAAIKALLELETDSNTILSNDPHLKSLSKHLGNLNSLVEMLHESKGCSNFLTRRSSTHLISRVTESIEFEIQAWIDRECLKNLTRALRYKNFMAKNEDELVSLLTQFIDRVSLSFDRKLQNLLLKTRVFSSLAKILCDPDCSKRIREYIASAIAGLIRFNKDVFVGQVLKEPTVHDLLSIASSHSIRVLYVLIKFIKFYDEEIN